MLEFLPAMYPWSYITDGMLEEMPVGDFYLLSENTLPRSSKPNKFWLVTDNFIPTRIYINGDLAGEINPKSSLQVIQLSLYEPPDTNLIVVDNGMDEPIQLKVAITNMAKHIEAFGREIYEYAGRTNEKYTNLIASPWTSFLIDYQLPFRHLLPSVRSLRIMATKKAAYCLFNETGQSTGIYGLCSAFTSTTPVVNAVKNPPTWRPHLHPLLPSGFNQAGFDFHIWMPNLCLARWAAFVKLMHNNHAYEFNKISEEVVQVASVDTVEWEQHLFDTIGPGCSALDALLALGCMDSITAAGIMNLNSDISICFYANPFDQIVEFPGIGGNFFDSDTTFDGNYGNFDNVYDLDIYTDFWVDTPLSKRFDFGKCLDEYASNSSYLPEDVACCNNVPDTVLLSTMLCAETTTSTNTPNHPLYGGDDPGIVSNPYFDLLEY